MHGLCHAGPAGNSVLIYGIFLLGCQANNMIRDQVIPWMGHIAAGLFSGRDKKSCPDHLEHHIYRSGYWWRLLNVAFCQCFLGCICAEIIQNFGAGGSLFLEPRLLYFH
jgi:hypothetical protein